MLKIDIHTNEIPEIFARFRDVVGERHWIKHVTSIKEEIRGHPFLKDHLHEENDIAITLNRLSDLFSRYGGLPMQEAENRSLYPAICFAAQTLSIMDRSTDLQRQRLIRRIHGAFKNPDDMRAIQLEMVAATHFARRGHSIIWPEMDGGGTFDLLIDGIGTGGLEVECKSASRDKGRKIHRRDALEFHHLLKPYFESASRHLRTGLAVVLTVPGRLPTSIKDKRQLAGRVVESIIAGQGIASNDGTDIRVSEFDMVELGNLGTSGNPTIPGDVIDRVTATSNRETMVVGNRNGGAVVFVLQSQQDDTFLRYVFNTLSQAAKSQVSKTRPALFLVGLLGLEMGGLLNVARQDLDPQQQPTALRVAVSKFLESQERDHIVGVGFLSLSSLVPKLDGVVESGGTAYYFPKRESRFWHQDFTGLFSS